MENCFEIIENATKFNTIDSISLSYDNRFIRRKKLISDNKIEFLVNLPETVSLNENNGFLLNNGSIILIKPAKEELLEIVSDNLKW